jgi:hypothetical protein
MSKEHVQALQLQQIIRDMIVPLLSFYGFELVELSVKPPQAA